MRGVCWYAKRMLDKGDTSQAFSQSVGNRNVVQCASLECLLSLFSFTFVTKRTG